MPALDCGCKIVVTMESGAMVLQSERCPLHEMAGDLRDRLAEVMVWAVDCEINGLTVDQLARFRDCLRRAREALKMATRTKGENQC